MPFFVNEDHLWQQHVMCQNKKQRMLNKLSDDTVPGLLTNICGSELRYRMQPDVE